MFKTMTQSKNNLGVVKNQNQELTGETSFCV